MSNTVVDVLARLRADSTDMIRGLRNAASEARRMDGAFRDAEGRWRDASGRFVSASRRAEAGVRDLSNESSRAGGRIRSLASHLLHVGGVMAKVAGMASGLVSLLGPLAIGVVKVVSATAKLAGTLAPLAATLPALAAGLALVKGTVMMAGPAMQAAVKPVVDSFTKMQDRIGKLASASLPALSRGFVKVNIPTIQSGMERIAKAMDGVISRVGTWVNSSAGQAAIAMITNSTASAAERLAPKMAAVAIAIGNMVNRVGDPAIKGFADLLGAIADRARTWADSVTKADITRGILTAKEAAGGLSEKMRAIKEVVSWLANNQGKIKAFSDALAVIGIAIGVATGGWVAVLAGSVTLALNHWGKFKEGLTAAWKAAEGAWAAIVGNVWVQQIVTSLRRIAGLIKGDFIAAWAAVKPYLVAFGDAAGRAWDKIGPLVVRVLENKQVQAGLRAMALGIAAVVAALAAWAAATTVVTGLIVGAFSGLIAWLVGTFVVRIAGVVRVCLNAFGSFAHGLGSIISRIPGMEGVGRALMRAGDSAKNAANKVQDLANRLAGVKSRTVTVTVKTIGGGVTYAQYSDGSVLYKNPSGGSNRARARGGPVAAGQAYLVGENGPEMITPSRSGYVWPSGKGPSGASRALSGGGPMGGGPTRVVLEIRSSGSRMDNLIVEEIRKAIRTRAHGSVQLALGMS